MTGIRAVRARQVFDSRGRPTVEADVTLADGAFGRASVPSGASTGSHEAYERRDGDVGVYGGLGVTRAVAHVNGEIAAAVRGHDAADQRGVDRILTDLDGTARLARLGANAVLATSLAVCRAAAASARTPVYRWIAVLAATPELVMPIPMVNILSGGLHAGRGMDVQDFLAVPVRAASTEQALAVVSAVRDAAGEVMGKRGLSVLVADEGGLSPGLATAADALLLMVEACEHAGLEPGLDMDIAVDVAAHGLFDPDRGDYVLAREGRRATTAEMIDLVAGWVRDFPVISVEDALDEDDWDGWRTLTDRLGGSIRLIGDDLFTTNPARLARGVAAGCANGVLVKPNQNGTLSGTLDVIATARRAGFATVISARSGETEDPFVADLAVGVAAGQIKIGSLRGSDRLAKYNQLLRIAEESGARYASPATLAPAAPR